jgi:hypothetical protein
LYLRALLKQGPLSGVNAEARQRMMSIRGTAGNGGYQLFHCVRRSMTSLTEAAFWQKLSIETVNFRNNGLDVHW